MLNSENGKNIEVFKKSDDVKDILTFDPLEVCKIYSESLPYPVVVLQSDGVIVYKNSKLHLINCKWRLNACVLRYVGKETFFSILSTKCGSYNAIFVCNMGVAVLKIDEFFFLVFMPSFELTEASVSFIYERLGDIPEENFFEKRGIAPNDSFSKEQKESWGRFKCNFEKFYRMRCSYSDKVSGIFLKEMMKKRHNIVGVLEEMIKAVNNSSAELGCKIRAKNFPRDIDIFVNCMSSDLAVILNMTIFLCVKCSNAKRPVLELSIYKNFTSSVGRISMFVKSDVSPDEVKRCFDSQLFFDERALYYETISFLASKYFWGFNVCKDEKGLHFIFTIPEENILPLRLHDPYLQSTARFMEMFAEFSEIMREV